MTAAEVKAAPLNAAAHFQRSRTVHAAAKKCHCCGKTPTHGVDSKGRPFCADCRVSRMPHTGAKDWRPGKALQLLVEREVEE